MKRREKRMTVKQLAAKAFDEGQRIRLTAVPLIEKEKTRKQKAATKLSLCRIEDKV